MNINMPIAEPRLGKSFMTFKCSTAHHLAVLMQQSISRMQHCFRNVAELHVCRTDKMMHCHTCSPLPPTTHTSTQPVNLPHSQAMYSTLTRNKAVTTSSKHAIGMLGNPVGCCCRKLQMQSKGKSHQSTKRSDAPASCRVQTTTDGSWTISPISS